MQLIKRIGAVAAIAAGGFLLADSAGAQQTATVSGIVRTAGTATPLDLAEVELMGELRRFRTGVSGRFKFDSLTPGRYFFAVRRIGFSPARIAVTISPGEQRDVVFELTPVPQDLPEITVRVEEGIWQRSFTEFRHRNAAARGNFVTRDDIDRINPLYLSNLVSRYIPNVSRVDNGSADTDPPSFNPLQADPFGEDYLQGRGTTSLINAASQEQRSLTGVDRTLTKVESLVCRPLVSLNGDAPNAGYRLNDFPPSRIEAIEVYRANRIPPQFRQTRLSTPCGLVVLWLR